MLDNLASDYASYFKVNVSSGFQTVQDVIDNMLTRLEELTTVLQMIKLKNSDCATAVSEDISKYRSEITALSKKVNSVDQLVHMLHNNMNMIEKRVEKAEIDFGVNNDSTIKSFLKSFLKRNKEDALTHNQEIIPTEPNEHCSVSEFFQLPDNNT